MGRKSGVSTIPTVATQQYGVDVLGIINGIACIVYGYVLYSIHDFNLFLLSVFAVFLMVTSYVTELINKMMYRTIVFFLTIAPAMIFVGYLVAPVFDTVFRAVYYLVASSGKFIVSAYPTSLLGAPIVVFIMPLFVAAINALIDSIYLSAVISGFRYPFLVFAVMLPISVFKVLFTTYIMASYIVYIISVVIVAGFNLFVSLVESLASLAGLAFALFGDAFIVKWIVNVPVTAVSTFVEVTPEIKSDISKFYALWIAIYIVYGASLYATVVGIWHDIALASLIIIAAATLSTMVFYLSRMEQVSFRIVRKIVVIASGLEALAMVIVISSGMAIDAALDSVITTMKTLSPLYGEFINTLLRFLFGGGL